MSSASRIPLTLVVAATPKNGIGANGGLPWPMLKNEMAYFKRVTTRVLPSNSSSTDNSDQTQNPSPRNVLIMGRRTWESIPLRLRPLKGRTNVVITTQPRSNLGSLPADVFVAADLPRALQSLESAVKTGHAPPIARAFVIGGARVYADALKLPQTTAVLLTRIHREFECDTFIPDIEGDAAAAWERASHDELERFVGEAVPREPVAEGEGDARTTYEFQLYQRPMADGQDGSDDSR